jgi:hypothetical protein
MFERRLLGHGLPQSMKTSSLTFLLAVTDKVNYKTNPALKPSPLMKYHCQKTAEYRHPEQRLALCWADKSVHYCHLMPPVCPLASRKENKHKIHSLILYLRAKATLGRFLGSNNRWNTPI